MGVAGGEDSIDQTLALVHPIRLQQGDYLAPVETVRLGLLGTLRVQLLRSRACRRTEKRGTVGLATLCYTGRLRAGFI